MRHAYVQQAQYSSSHLFIQSFLYSLLIYSSGSTMCQAPHGPWVDYTEQAQWGQMKSGRCQDTKFQLYPD